MVEIENESEKKYKYDAFISYRHIEPDLTIAKILHETIEKFNIPKHLRTASNEEREADRKVVVEAINGEAWEALKKSEKLEEI